jgi:hypothetical protein
MTLNLTLAARWMIVQTSDFKLTTGPGKPPEETAQKQVVLRYSGWSGLLCYASRCPRQPSLCAAINEHGRSAHGR